jgi:hypothetical protein
MNYTTRAIRRFGRGAVVAGMFAAMAFGASAQDTTTKSVRHGTPTYETNVKNSEVVYVEGNDLVLRTESGKVEHLIVPDSDAFTIDGKDVTVHELTPGTKLTQTITTTTMPHYVTTVRTLKGKIWHVAVPGTVHLRLPDNSIQVYRIPSDAKITVDGQQKTVFDLRKGMTIQATIVTDGQETVAQHSKAFAGQAPPPATPKFAGLLLFVRPAPPVAPSNIEQVSAADESITTTLPKTASLVPLTGVLGSIAIAMSLGLGLVRKAVRL